MSRKNWLKKKWSSHWTQGVANCFCWWNKSCAFAPPNKTTTRKYSLCCRARCCKQKLQNATLNASISCCTSHFRRSASSSGVSSFHRSELSCHFQSLHQSPLHCFQSSCLQSCLGSCHHQSLHLFAHICSWQVKKLSWQLRHWTKYGTLKSPDSSGCKSMIMTIKPYKATPSEQKCSKPANTGREPFFPKQRVHTEGILQILQKV